MNFFKLYIGDYQRDTAHLSIAEHGAYLLMIQHYCATEKPLPVGRALYRMLRAQSKVETDAIDAVADEFWTKTDSGLTNARAAVEIEKSHAQAEANRKVAEAREAKKRATDEQRNASRQEHESCTNRSTIDQPNHSHSHIRSKDKDAYASSSAAAPADPSEVSKSESKTARLAEVTDEATAAYNVICAKPAGLLPKATQPGRAVRQKNIRRVLALASSICAEQYGDPRITQQFWADYFSAVQADDFKSGRQGGGRGHENWLPDFEYLTRQDVMLEVFERAVTEVAA